MSIFEIISVSVAVAALLVSTIAVFFSGIQTRKATEAMLLEHQLARGNAVMHFTSRFFDLVKNGDLAHLIADPDLGYQFWSLHATEFYFFHYGILPTFMYTLWMIDLAKLYCGPSGSQIRESHVKYLNTYSFNYPEMVSFFYEIYKVAKDCGDENLRNKVVANYVTTWIGENRKSVLA